MPADPEPFGFRPPAIKPSGRLLPDTRFPIQNY